MLGARPIMSPELRHLLPTLISVPIVALLLYRRLRRSFGRQPVRPVRMGVRMALLCAVCALLLALSPHAPSFAAAACGLALGVALALVGLKYTTFESTADGRFYTPNKWLGIAVTALVLGRVAARVFVAAGQTPAPEPGQPIHPPPPTTLTIGILFLMGGYYVAYYAGILLRARASPPPVTDPPPRLP